MWYILSIMCLHCCMPATACAGDGSNISHSVIGRNCRIGKNVTLQGAYLQDDVTVGEGACVTYSLLCERVVIRPGAAPGGARVTNVMVHDRRVSGPGDEDGDGEQK